MKKIILFIFCIFSITGNAQPGTLDLSFGTGGKITTDFGSNCIGRAVAIQNDFKIVLSGQSIIDSTYDFALVRYNSDGSLDSTFGSGGTVNTAIGNNYDVSTSIVIQIDQKIVVAGYSGTGFVSDFALVRYNSNGTLDNMFGSNGKVLTDFSGTSDKSFSVAIQDDGKIIVAGTSETGSNKDFALARYNIDGILDTTVKLSII